MRTYDERGNRVPTSRDVRPRTGYVAGFVWGVLATVCTLAIWLWVYRYQGEQTEEEQPVSVGTKVEPMTVTYDHQGEATRYYVMTDPDTNVQYIVNDRGGMCARVIPYE